MNWTGLTYLSSFQFCRCVHVFKFRGTPVVVIATSRLWYQRWGAERRRAEKSTSASWLAPWLTAAFIASSPSSHSSSSPARAHRRPPSSFRLLQLLKISIAIMQPTSCRPTLSLSPGLHYSDLLWVCRTACCTSKIQQIKASRVWVYSLAPRTACTIMHYSLYSKYRPTCL